MKRFTAWHAAMFAIALSFLLITTGVGAQSDATPDHGAHHAGTPTAGTACTVPATPGGGMPGMGTNMPGMGMGASTPMPGMTVAFDLMFIDMTIPHHESAVAMANVALERAEHDEIRGLAEAVIAGQSTEIEQMRQWRDAW